MFEVTPDKFKVTPDKFEVSQHKLPSGNIFPALFSISRYTH